MEDLDTKALQNWESDSGFKTIYQHYAPYVWRVSFRMVNGNRDLAEDITQTVFVKLLKTIKHFKSNSRFSTWLYTITYRETLYALKKRKRNWSRESTLPNESQSDEQLHDKVYEQQQEVQRLLAPLSTDERFLLVSREIEGLSFEEIAQITGKKEGALRTSLSRLKTQIKGGYHE